MLLGAGAGEFGGDQEVFGPTEGLRAAPNREEALPPDGELTWEADSRSFFNQGGEL